MLRFRLGVYLSMLAVVLAACGGGSPGGSSQNPTPPPPPPPSVVIESTQDTVLSGAVIGAQVSGTADGLATATVTMSCTNDVDVTLDGSKVEFSFPEVSVLTESVCTASVSDTSGQTANDTLTFTILPETDIGQMVGKFDPPLKLILPNFNGPEGIDSYGGHVITIAESPSVSGSFHIKAIEGTSQSPKQYHRDDIVLVEGNYQSIDFVQSPSLPTHGLPTASLSIASVLESKIYWMLQDLQTKEFTVRVEIDVNNPCFIAETNTFWANDMVVGQRNAGLTVFDIETGSDFTTTESFTPTPIQRVGGSRSLCHIFRAGIPDGIAARHPGYTGNLPFDPAYALPLTAIDYDSLELVYFGDIDGDNELEEMGSTPIETNATGQLKIVQVISRGTPNQVPQYLLVLLTDGNHIGEHRLVQIDSETDSAGEFVQQVVHAWDVGVPVSMMQGPLGGSMEGGIFRPDLAVVLGTAEQSFFFDNLLPLDAGFSLPPVYGAPTKFKVGVGAGSAVAVETPYSPTLLGPNNGVLVSYPDSGEVFYISLPITN